MLQVCSGLPDCRRLCLDDLSGASGYCFELLLLAFSAASACCLLLLFRACFRSGLHWAILELFCSCKIDGKFSSFVAEFHSLLSVRSFQADNILMQ